MITADSVGRHGCGLTNRPHRSILRGLIEAQRSERSSDVPNIKQARKRARQNEERRQHNQSQRSRYRTHVKKVRYALRQGDVEAATEAYQRAAPVLDAMVSKGIVHRNKAARHKSRLNTKIKALRQ